MPTATVTQLDDERLIREGEAAARFRKPMALGLLAAKRKYEATRDFGEWLRGSPYGQLNRTDRAALIKIGEHEARAATFLPTTDLISPRLIWEAMEAVIRAEQRRAACAAAMAGITTSHDVNSTETAQTGQADTDHDDGEDEAEEDEIDEIALEAETVVEMIERAIDIRRDTIEKVRTQGDQKHRSRARQGLAQARRRSHSDRRQTESETPPLNASAAEVMREKSITNLT